MTYEKHYHARGYNISQSEIDKIEEVAKGLMNSKDKGKPTGSGRKYSLEHGSVEYRIGNEPRLTIRSETKEGLEKTIKELNL